MIFSVNFTKNNEDVCSLFCTAYDKVMFYDVNSNFEGRYYSYLIYIPPYNIITFPLDMRDE